MPRVRFVLLGVVMVLTAGLAWAGGDSGPQLLTAHGTVDKVGKGSLTIQTRTAAGQFGKKLMLKITGTSKITTLTQQKRAGKLVMVQNEAAATDLAEKQAVAVIYAEAKGGPVLLSAVVLPSPAK